jgi:hypothetical protein
MKPYTIQATQTQQPNIDLIPAKVSESGDDSEDYYLLPKNSVAFLSHRDLMHLFDLKYAGNIAPIKGLVNDLINRGRAVRMVNDAEVEIIDALAYDMYGHITKINVKGTTAQGWVRRSDLLLPIKKACNDAYAFYKKMCIRENLYSKITGPSFSAIISQARNRLDMEQFVDLCARGCSGDEPRVNAQYFHSTVCRGSKIVVSGIGDDSPELQKQKYLQEMKHHADIARRLERKLHDARQ